MITARRRHIDQSYPGKGTREAAVSQLVRGYLADEVLRAQGVHLDDEALRAERDRRRRQTRAPERLRRIEASYGDEESYLLVGVLPDFARQRLFRWYQSTPRFTDAARRAASRFLDDATARGDLRAAARGHGLEVRRVRAHPKRGVRPADADPNVEAADAPAARRLIALLADVDDGEIHPRLLETPDGFRAVRLIERRRDRSIDVEMVAFQRPAFEAWLRDRERQIPIVVRDESLEPVVQATVSRRL